MFREFLWFHQRPCIKLQLLHLLKPRGGGGSPRCVGLIQSSTPHQDSGLALPCWSKIVGGHGIGGLQWHSKELSLDRFSPAKSPCDHPTLGSMLLVARDAFRHSSILPSPIVPVLRSPEFVQGLQNPNFRHLALKGCLHLCDFFGTGWPALLFCLYDSCRPPFLLLEWFPNAQFSSSVFTLPGYTLPAHGTGGYLP